MMRGRRSASFARLSGLSLARSPGRKAPGQMLAARKQLAAEVKIFYARILRETEAWLEAHPRAGLRAAAKIAQARDAIIARLFAAATREWFPNPNPGTGEHLAVLAQGGYGKGLCAPYSDMDLVFLMPHKPLPWCENVIEAMLYPLWDAGFAIGHTTGTPESQLLSAKEDMVRRTALLDARHLAGDKNLFDRLLHLRGKYFSEKQARAFVAAKLAEREARHQRSGASRYRVEPDVKDGKGGLRDLQTLDWISQYCYGAPAATALAQRGMISTAEQRRTRQCANLLWAVRCQLHLICGRREDRLSFARQPQLAARFAATPAPASIVPASIIQVERFMKTYFRAAKEVGDLTRILCALLEEAQAKPPALARLFARRAPSPAPGFLLLRGRLAFAPDAPEKPENLLRLFYEAARLQLPLHPKALAQARAAAPKLVPLLRGQKEAGKLFLDLLLQPGVEAALRRMSEAGVLTRFIPEFGRIAGQMQFNMYHHYTADEHTLRAIGALAGLRFGRGFIHEAGSREIELLPALCRRLSKEALRILFFALFCHDIAKGREGEDHSLAGAAAAKRLGRRLGLEKQACREAAFLVAHHLAMSQTSQRRDLDDPRTLGEFARLVETPQRLTLLLLLTLADIRAVGPDVWNGWKGALLGELYRKTLRFLSPHAAPSRAGEIALRRRRIEAKLCHWPVALRRRWLNLWPETYWLQIPPARAAAEADLWRQFRQGKKMLQLTRRDLPKRAVSEITALASDHPGLFARLAASFALAELNIVEARLMTGKDGIVLDRFFVQTLEGRPLGETGRLERLERLMCDVLAGKTLPEAGFAGPGFRARWHRLAPFPAMPHIAFDNEAAAHTLVEVNAPARPGLLAKLAACLFHQGLRVYEARISEFGERAVDVFSVTDGAGQKLTASRCYALRRAMVKMLADPPAPQPSPPAHAKTKAG